LITTWLIPNRQPNHFTIQNSIEDPMNIAQTGKILGRFMHGATASRALGQPGNSCDVGWMLPTNQFPGLMPNSRSAQSDSDFRSGVAMTGYRRKTGDESVTTVGGVNPAARHHSFQRPAVSSGKALCPTLRRG